MSIRIDRPASQGRLVIVDPRLDDYHDLIEPARKQLLRLTLTTTGSNALRLVPSFADSVWLLSPQLPDMNGLDLLEMLRSLQSSLKAVVIDNQYDAQREKRALELRAVQYVCKPLHLSWLKAWHGAPASVPDPKSHSVSPDAAEYLV
jgi:DNA-binding response OmpR family regulator